MEGCLPRIVVDLWLPEDLPLNVHCGTAKGSGLRGEPSVGLVRETQSRTAPFDVGRVLEVAYCFLARVGAGGVCLAQVMRPSIRLLPRSLPKLSGG